MASERVVTNYFFCTAAGDFFTIPTSLEVRKISNVSEALFYEGYDSYVERGTFCYYL